MGWVAAQAKQEIGTYCDRACPVTPAKQVKTTAREWRAIHIIDLSARCRKIDECSETLIQLTRLLFRSTFVLGLALPTEVIVPDARASASKASILLPLSASCSKQRVTSLRDEPAATARSHPVFPRSSVRAVLQFAATNSLSTSRCPPAVVISS